MTLQEFNTQSLADRADILYEWGFFIASQKSEDMNTVLYAVNGFFAEESISVSNNSVVDIKAFSLKELSKNHMATIHSKRAFLLMAPGVIHPGESGMTSVAG